MQDMWGWCRGNLFVCFRAYSKHLNQSYCILCLIHVMVQELKSRWTSILHHICNIHQWEEDGQERTCFHKELTADQQRRKRWLQKDSPAFKALSDLVLDKYLTKDLKQMTLFKHTGMPATIDFMLVIWNVLLFAFVIWILSHLHVLSLWHTEVRLYHRQLLQYR